MNKEINSNTNEYDYNKSHFDSYNRQKRSITPPPVLISTRKTEKASRIRDYSPFSPFKFKAKYNSFETPKKQRKSRIRTNDEFRRRINKKYSRKENYNYQCLKRIGNFKSEKNRKIANKPEVVKPKMRLLSQIGNTKIPNFESTTLNLPPKWENFKICSDLNYPHFAPKENNIGKKKNFKYIDDVEIEDIQPTTQPIFQSKIQTYGTKTYKFSSGKKKNNSKSKKQNFFEDSEKISKNINFEEDLKKPGKYWIELKTFFPKRSLNCTQDLKKFSQSKYSNKIKNSFHYMKLLETLEQKGQKFTDEQFPPKVTSLIGFGESQRISKKQLMDYRWARPEEIFNSKNFSIFNENSSPGCILQGMLGNCYFLSSLSSLMKNPKRLKKLFVKRSKSLPGCYCVALCINGIWEEITIDDFFPIFPFSKKPIFSSSKFQEIWLMILEKSWAKVHGGYLNTETGDSTEALHSLTGAPTANFKLNFEKNEEHWQQIKESLNKGYVVTVSSKNLNERILKGIYPSHSYSIEEIFEIEFVKGKRKILNSKESENRRNVERVVRLRDPWGKVNWGGAWGDSDARWDGGLRNEMGYGNEGVFFLNFNDFSNLMEDYQICFYDDKSIYSGQRYESRSKKPLIFLFEVRKPGEYCFSLIQISKRFFKSEKSNYFLKQF